MRLLIGSLALALSLSVAPAALVAQTQTAAPKVGQGEKVCRTKFKYTGVVKTWVCKKEELCCVWHEINYVKCGSTITGCL